MSEELVSSVSPSFLLFVPIAIFTVAGAAGVAFVPEAGRRSWFHRADLA